MENETALVVRQDLTPQIWEMLEKIGRAFCNSRKMSIHTAEEGAVRALFCLENQLPLTAARGLYFVNGKLGVESSVIAALIRQHPRYDYVINKLDDTGCEIVITVDGTELGRASFGDAEAERAGLLKGKKDTYRKYPSDMYFAKAIVRAQRRYAPDIFMAATYSTEEMKEWDIIDVEPEPPAPTHEALIEQYGNESYIQAGGGSATTKADLRAVAQRLAEMDSDVVDGLFENEPIDATE